jgi:hypothetical protein
VRETSSRTPRRGCALAASAALLLGACGGGGDGGGTGGGDAGADASAPPSTPVPSATVEVRDGLELTAPGTQLAFGDTATVAHEAGKQSGVLELTVESAVQGSIKDFVGFDLDDPYKRRGNYYYVRVSVTNVGKSRLGGIAVPLWGLSGDNTLLQAVAFTSSFKKCPTERLPDRFRPDDEFKTCLVYLSPDQGELEGVSYRPTEQVVPIEWRGEVKRAAKPGKKQKKRGGQG